MLNAKEIRKVISHIPDFNTTLAEVVEEIGEINDNNFEIDGATFTEVDIDTLLTSPEFKRGIIEHYDIPGLQAKVNDYNDKPQEDRKEELRAEIAGILGMSKGTEIISCKSVGEDKILGFHNSKISLYAEQVSHIDLMINMSSHEKKGGRDESIKDGMKKLRPELMNVVKYHTLMASLQQKAKFIEEDSNLPFKEQLQMMRNISVHRQHLHNVYKQYIRPNSGPKDKDLLERNFKAISHNLHEIDKVIGKETNKLPKKKRKKLLKKHNDYRNSQRKLLTQRVEKDSIQLAINHGVIENTESDIKDLMTGTNKHKGHIAAEDNMHYLISTYDPNEDNAKRTQSATTDKSTSHGRTTGKENFSVKFIATETDRSPKEESTLRVIVTPSLARINKGKAGKGIVNKQSNPAEFGKFGNGAGDFHFQASKNDLEKEGDICIYKKSMRNQFEIKFINKDGKEEAIKSTDIAKKTGANHTDLYNEYLQAKKDGGLEDFVKEKFTSRKRTQRDIVNDIRDNKIAKIVEETENRYPDFNNGDPDQHLFTVDLTSLGSKDEDTNHQDESFECDMRATHEYNAQQLVTRKGHNKDNHPAPALARVIFQKGINGADFGSSEERDLMNMGASLLLLYNSLKSLPDTKEINKMREEVKGQLEKFNAEYEKYLTALNSNDGGPKRFSDFTQMRASDFRRGLSRLPIPSNEFLKELSAKQKRALAFYKIVQTGEYENRTGEGLTRSIFTGRDRRGLFIQPLITSLAGDTKNLYTHTHCKSSLDRNEENYTRAAEVSRGGINDDIDQYLRSKKDSVTPKIGKNMETALSNAVEENGSYGSAAEMQSMAQSSTGSKTAPSSGWRWAPLPKNKLAAGAMIFLSAISAGSLYVIGSAVYSVYKNNVDTNEFGTIQSKSQRGNGKYQSHKRKNKGEKAKEYQKEFAKEIEKAENQETEDLITEYLPSYQDSLTIDHNENDESESTIIHGLSSKKDLSPNKTPTPDWHNDSDWTNQSLNTDWLNKSIKKQMNEINQNIDGRKTSPAIQELLDKEMDDRLDQMTDVEKLSFLKNLTASLSKEESTKSTPEKSIHRSSPILRDENGNANKTKMKEQVTPKDDNPDMHLDTSIHT